MRFGLGEAKNSRYPPSQITENTWLLLFIYFFFKQKQHFLSNGTCWIEIVSASFAYTQLLNKIHLLSCQKKFVCRLESWFSSIKTSFQFSCNCTAKIGFKSVASQVSLFNMNVSGLCDSFWRHITTKFEPCTELFYVLVDVTFNKVHEINISL